MVISDIRSIVSGALRLLKTSLGESFILGKLMPFKLDWFRSSRLFRLLLLIIGRPSECSVWLLSKDTFDFVGLAFSFSIITKLISKIPLSSIASDVFVDRSCSSICKERLIIEIVIFLIAESSIKACSLIEQSLIVHNISRCWLCLAQGNLFGNISVLFFLEF